MAPPRQQGLTPPRRAKGTRLTASESRWAYIGAAAAAVAFCVIQVVPAHRSPTKAAIGVAIAVLLALSARTNHRIAVAVGCLAVTFGPWSYYSLFAAPYYVFALILLYRGRRQQDPAEPAPVRRRRRGSAVATDGDDDDDESDDGDDSDDRASGQAGGRGSVVRSSKVKPHPRSKKKKARKPR